MTTGREVVTRALQLLGYVDEYGDADALLNAALRRRAAAAVAQITAELAYARDAAATQPEEAGGWDDPLPLPPQAIDDVMPYGVAMLLALSQGDAVQQELFATLYATRRAALDCPRRQRVDCLPR